MDKMEKWLEGDSRPVTASVSDSGSAESMLLPQDTMYAASRVMSHIVIGDSRPEGGKGDLKGFPGG